MKIVYISNSTIPSKAANSIHVMKMCQAFSENGHNISLYLPNIENITHKQEIFDLYNIKNKFPINYLLYINVKGGGYIYNLQAVIKAKLNGVELVYCRDIHTAFFCDIFKVNYILEMHGPLENFSNILQKMFIYLTKSKKVKLVVITASLKKYYLNKFNTLTNKIYIAPDGADEFQDFKKKISFDKNKLNIGYTGHLYKGKGMEVIYKLAPLCDFGIFHIVGGTDIDLEYWKNKCKNLNNIVFHGFVNQTELKIYLNSFDIVLLPNQKVVRGAGKVKYDIGQWTSPLKLFEYMAARKTIIASNIEVLKEVLIHNENGYLCDPENIDEWLEAIKVLKNNSNLSTRLAQNAFDDFMEKYSWKKRVENIIDFFKVNIK